MKNISKLKRLFLTLILTGTLFTVSAQQEPMYTQYVFNMQTVNPGYVGSWQTIGFVALTRHQWVGINGYPSTQSFSIQTPFRSENVGLGFNVVNDRIGLEKRLMMSIDYSYRLSISRNSSLRLGIKGGFTNYNNPLNAYSTYSGEPNDPNFQGYIDNKFMPNIGVGAFLSSAHYYVGLSVPKLIETTFKYTAVDNGNISTEAYTKMQDLRQYYLIAGYVFDLSRSVKFKPTMFTRVLRGAPIQFDLSANFLFNDKFWVGAMYRSDDAVGAVFQWIYNDRFRIGYAVDFTTTNLRHYHSGTHEIMLSYELDWKRFVSPRYF